MKNGDLEKRLYDLTAGSTALTFGLVSLLIKRGVLERGEVVEAICEVMAEFSKAAAPDAAMRPGRHLLALLMQDRTNDQPN